jgi:hypothetical protein
LNEEERAKKTEDYWTKRARKVEDKGTIKRRKK